MLLVTASHGLSNLITIFICAGDALGHAPAAIIVAIVPIAVADRPDRNALVADGHAWMMAVMTITLITLII